MNLPDLMKLPLDKKRAILSALSKAKSGGTEPVLAASGAMPRQNRNGHGKALEFSLLFFSEDSGDSQQDRYLLVRECARFADENGFKAIWVPERHFHRFGAIYPDPAVLSAALASSTRHVRLRAGSVVLPLEDPLRVVEAWAMVDNLSAGRVDISFASGWNPNDFVLSPETFPRTKEVLSERIQEVRLLWRGGAVRRQNGKGEWVEIRTFPRPVQPELNAWFTAAANPKSFEEAGELGCNLLTMLFSSGVEELAQKIQLYRRARERAEVAGEGCVTLMLHAFVGPDAEFVQGKVRKPFLNYIRGSLDVQRHGQSEKWDEKQLDQMAEFAYERYYRTGALFGTPQTCLDLLRVASEGGVDEVACQMDFGIDAESVLKSLKHLKDLKERHELSLEPARIQNPGWKEAQVPVRNGAADRSATEAIAIIGMSGRFPQADDLEEFWDNLVSGRNVFTEFPSSRGPTKEGVRFRGGFLKDVEGFDAESFGLSAREAALMDPHQRLFLETTWRTMEDAGYEPGKLAGSRTGVWVAMYSPDFNQRISDSTEVDSEGLIGRLHVMVANRVSHLLDLRGPSEIVDTACSSSLVAIDRAIQSLRSGECDAAIAGGVSLLLSPVSTQWLGAVEMLSAEGTCRPFDARAKGMVRGEGVGAVLLKPLGQAIKDGDCIHAVVRGCGTNHNGRREGSLTTPSLSAQADLLVQTYESAGIDPGSISYIEAHGAASELGDYVEISAFKRAFSRLAQRLPKDSCGIGTVKASIGALDSAGGIAALMKVLLALRKQQWPGMPGVQVRPDFELESSPFYLTGTTEPWAQKELNGKTLPRRAAVHAFGLGGVNAHVVIEEHLPATSRKNSLPHRAFAHRRFRLPCKPVPLLQKIQPRPKGVLIRTRFDAADPLVADHAFRGMPLLSAAVMCEMARAAGQIFELGRVQRVEGLCFPNPLRFTETEVEARLEVEVNERSARFQLCSSENAIHAEGMLRWPEAPARLPERIDVLQTRVGNEVGASQFYERFERLGISYGPLYRTVKSVTFNEEEAFAKIALPPGFESEAKEYGLHPGLLDAVLQLCSVFSPPDAQYVHLPFCIELIEWHGPIATAGFACLRKHPPEALGLHKFDGAITDATGRVLVTLKDLCLQPVRNEEEPSLESILEQVADGHLSVEAADRLLSGPERSSSVEAFAKGLSARHPAADLTFRLQLDAEMWRIGGASVSRDTSEENLPLVKLTQRDFERLLEGECDPTVLFLQGAIALVPENLHALKQKIGGFWFEKFNARHLPGRFRDHLAGSLYARGEVVLSSGMRRDVFPWTISAQVGGILYESILREKPARTLEIGMAYGLSSLFICQAHQDKNGGEHVAIDPCQREEFLTIGLHHVERAGLASYLRFIEEPDYIALPSLLAVGNPFQLIFIDGLHMFDYTLLDFFYCDRLLTEGGILLFDDCLAPGVARVIEYVGTNRQYEPLTIDCPRLAGFRKISSDARSLEDPNFHREF